MCLQWWPVDIVQGEQNMFSDDQAVGYFGRKPLYYCVEAAGNYAKDVGSKPGVCSPLPYLRSISKDCPSDATKEEDCRDETKEDITCLWEGREELGGGEKGHNAAECCIWDAGLTS